MNLMADVLVAGVDCSTQSTKVLVVDAATGVVVATGRGTHEVTGTQGARETHPDQWWTALAAALEETGRAGDIAAISVAGQQHGLVVVGADDRPLRPATLWNDTRSAPDATALIDDLGGPAAWADRIGCVPVASLTVTSWAWLRRTEPEVAARVRKIRLPHDEVTFRLTGRSVTDRGDASGTGWWSTADEAYSGEVLGLERISLDAAALPEVLGPADPAGAVTATAAGALGLREGIPVGPGTGDNMAAALGLGLRPGQAAMSLGTSGTVYATTPRRTADTTGIVAGFADATGRYLPLAATLNSTLAVDRVAGWLGIERDAVDAPGDVVVMPFFDGERTPDLPDAAASIVGLRHTTTPGEVLQATYDGVVFSLLEALERIAVSAGGLADDPLLLIGGGARGSAWRETVRRLSGRPLRVPDVEEAVALGAAAQAAAVLAGRTPSDVVAAWDRTGGDLLPPVERDDAALARHRTVRERARALNDPQG